MIRLKVAFRNIFRNRGRSALSVLMVAGSVLGIIAFQGFSSHILQMLRDTTIDNQYNHIQVAMKDKWDMKPGPLKQMLLKDPKSLIQDFSNVSGVTMVSSRLSFHGLISTGETTISAQGIGYTPEKETHFKKSLSITDGRNLNEDEKYEATVGVGLKKRLNINIGDNLTVISYTLDGIINAMDLEVVGFFRVGKESVDSHVFMLPLSVAQQLLDTSYAENITLRIDDLDALNEFVPKIDARAQAISPGAQAKSWYELADHYRSVEEFYKLQNFIVEIILISLVFLSIMNSVGMSIFERTGEIGTIRALGDTPSTVVFQFLIEGALIGALGVIVGCLLSVLLSYGVHVMGFTMLLPNASFPIPIEIKIAPLGVLSAAALAIVTSVLATLLPSVRATKISIVDALRRNI